MTMFTDPTHLRIEDPGHTEGNPVFIYLSALVKEEHFEKFLPAYKNLDELKAHYEKGGLGDVVVKKFLAKVLNDTLDPIRKRRKEYEADIPSVYKILEEGSIKAREKAESTAVRVRRAIGLNYFENKKMIEKQAKAFKKKLADEQKMLEYLAKQKKN